MPQQPRSVTRRALLRARPTLAIDDRRNSKKETVLERADSGNDPDDNPSTYQEELRTFLFLTVVTAPVLAVAIVGGYGFVIWMYQLFTGDLPG